MNMAVKKGDSVVVITGKDKGKTGKVLEVFPESNRVLVDGVNIVTKHKKARSQNEKSEKVKKNAPIDASNVMIVCPSCGKATRVYHKEVDGKKVRVCKCGVSLDKAYVKSTKKDAKKAKEVVKEDKAAKPETTKTTKAVETKKTTAKAETAKTEKPAAKKPAEKKTTDSKSTTSAKKPAAKPAAKSGKTTTQKSKTSTKKEA